MASAPAEPTRPVTVLRSDLPRGWHGRIRRGLFFLTAGAVHAALAFVVCGTLLLSPSYSALGPGQVLPAVALFFYVLSICGLLLGAGLLARFAIEVDRGGSFAAIILGFVLFSVTGMLEVFGATGITSRVVHSALALGSILLLVVGLATVPRPVASLYRLLAIDDRRLTGMARRIRYLSYAVMAASILLPFAPNFFPGVTPRVCIERSAGVVSLLVALPLMALAYLSVRLQSEARLTLDRLTHCPECGYPREPGERCPECGHDVRGA